MSESVEIASLTKIMTLYLSYKILRQFNVDVENCLVKVNGKQKLNK